MAIIAAISNLTKSYSSLTVLKDANLAIKSGEKIGLVGANGSGKTTLLEIIAGQADFDAGSVDVAKGIRIQYLPQSLSFSEMQLEQKLIDFAGCGARELNQLKVEIERLALKMAEDTASAPEKLRYAEALQAFELGGGYSADATAEKITAGVGFARSMFDAPLSSLSGGEQNRARLARLLVSNPDLMLLDEPTNHLDIQGLEFLEQHIHDSRAAAIIVSHDRRFLDRTVGKIWQVRATKVEVFAGNFSAYLESRQKQDDLALKAYVRQQELRRKTQAFIQKYIAGQRSKQAKSRRKMLERLPALEKPPAAERSMGMAFGDVSRSGRIVCGFDNVIFSYGAKELLRRVSFVIERGESVGLIGANGSGKTTLLELIVGGRSPDEGEVHVGKKLNIGYFRQSGAEFDLADRPIDIVGRMLPDYTEGRLRDYLARFLFEGDDVFRPMRTFSGGQRSRLRLAILLAGQPNFVILDEPTNHLDIPSREALENALSDYKGTLLAVSHDRYFLDNIVEKLFCLADGHLTVFPGNYSYYESRIREQTAEESRAVSPAMPKNAQPEEIAGSATRRGPKRVNPLVIKKVEDEIGKLEAELRGIYEAIDSGDYASDWQKLQGFQVDKEKIENELLELFHKLDQITETSG